jgi:hypothetical protein
MVGAMTWMAERPENGTENKVLYDDEASKNDPSALPLLNLTPQRIKI